MSEARHTPSPWTITELAPDDCGEQEPTFRIEAEPTLFLTIAPCSDGFVFGQNEANARLIAAAPELLAECERLLEILKIKAQAPPKLGDWNWPMLAEDLATVVAKAKGETAHE